MPRNIESELRRSLQARAEDVTADPELFSRVQTKIRRGRVLRLAFAGAGAALVIAAVAIAAPNMVDRRIEFEPAPFATQPAPELTTTPDVTGGGDAARDIVFTDGVAVYATTIDRPTTTALLQSDYAPSCPSAADCHPIQQVLTDGGAGTATSTLLTVEGCGGLRYGAYTGADARIDTTVYGSEHCPTSAAFSPDARHLAWVSGGGPTPVSVSVVPWSASGPTGTPTGLGSLWTDATDVQLLDWVWTAEDGETAEGYLVLRVWRNGSVQVTQVPIERQGDGEVAVSLGAGSVPWSPGATPWAFAAAGDVTYTLEVELAPNGPENGRIVRRVAGATDGQLDLPPELFANTNTPFSESDLWLSASEDAVVYGNTGQGRAWFVDWSGPQPQRSDIAATADVPVAWIDLVHAGDPAAPVVEEPAQIQVDVFFAMEGADDCVASEPVQRTVEGPGVARGALTHLLAGPTSRESNEGVTSPFTANTADALNDVAIVEGEARVDFADFRDAVGSDSCTKSAIIDALNSTLLQFPTVHSTRYSFDGDVAAFEAWLGSSGEGLSLPPTVPPEVAETARAIHAAAAAHDYEALEALTGDQFSCTFSDQPEPCVPVWQEQEFDGQDPLGTLVEILQTDPVRNPNAPIWVWPAAWLHENNYLGPRTGIDADGTWLFYQQGGD